jgi:hypothetical protein
LPWKLNRPPENTNLKSLERSIKSILFPYINFINGAGIAQSV